MDVLAKVARTLPLGMRGIGLALLLLTATGARAQAPQYRRYGSGPGSFTTPVSPAGSVWTEHYDDAAAAVGFGDWGSAQDCRVAVHVLVDLDATQANLTIGMPPGFDPQGFGLPDFQRLAPACPISSETVTPQPEADYYQITFDGLPATTAPGDSSVVLHLSELGARLSRASHLPVVAAVRLAGAEAATVNPAPAARVRFGPDEFHFYPLAGPSASQTPVTLEYRVPIRWRLAMLAGVLILLFPLVTLFGVRAYTSSQDRLPPRQRMMLYRRWSRSIPFIPALVALFLVRSNAYLAYFGPTSTLLLPMLALALMLCSTLTARLIGLPLERNAWPARADLPWYRAVSNDLASLLIWGSMGVGMVLLDTASSRSGATVGGYGLVAGLLYYLPFFVVLGNWSRSIVVNVARSRIPLRGETDAPAELREAVLAQSERCGVPVRRVRIGPYQRGIWTGTVTVAGNLAVIGAEVLETLDATQAATLITAAALTCPSSRGGRIAAEAVTLAGPLLGVGLLAWLIRSVTVPTNPAILLSGLPIIAFAMIPLRHHARLRLRQADLRAAEASGAPLHYLEALRKLEELQLNTSGVNPCLPQLLPLFQRRSRLEHKLGVE